MVEEVQPFFKNSYVTLSASPVIGQTDRWPVPGRTDPDPVPVTGRGRGEESQQLIWRFCPRYQ